MSLSSDLAKISARNKQKLLKVAQNSLMRVGGSVVAKSPVDSGRFKNNWVAAYGAADTTTTNNNAKTAFGVEGGVVIGRLKAKLNGLDVGQVFYFTNSLPYAERLEYGWSEQAPGGMVRLSVANWQTIVAQEVARVK